MPTNLSASILDSKFVPTKLDFGIKKSTIFPETRPRKKGILLHHPETDSWTISGMPLLCQVDPALDGPLDEYINTIPADQLPQKSDAAGKPLFAAGKPVRFTPVEYRNAVKGVGCYNTSIVTVIITALANRAPDLKDALINRTKVFNEIKASGGVKKEINQLAWGYWQSILGFIGSKVDGKPVHPHYFHEVVADIGKGKIAEKCDPYTYGSCAIATSGKDASAFRTFNPSATQITNEIIINLMKAGTVPMIAYNRHETKAIINRGDTEIKGYTFKNNSSFHKVVFNGFQPGKFPLRIYDVGNGQAYNVRISSDLNEMKFDFSKKAKGSPDFDPAFVNRPFLIYEGEEQIVNNRIFFIDHLDGLRIRNENKLIVREIEKKILVKKPVKEPIIKEPIIKKGTSSGR